MPVSPNDLKKVNKFSAKTGLQGIMLGYKTKIGGQPTGDLYLLERSEIENATTAKQIYKERVIAIKQVFSIKETKQGKEHFKFPLASGEWKQPELEKAEKRNSEEV